MRVRVVVGIFLACFITLVSSSQAFSGKTPCGCNECYEKRESCGCVGCVTEQDEINISRNEPGSVRIRGCVGSGAVGVVYVAKQSNSDTRFSIKKISLASSVLDGLDHISTVVNELDALSAVRGHLYFPHANEAFIVNKNIYISMEYIGGGSLRQVVQNWGPLDVSLCQIYCKMLMTAVSYLHQQRIVHRDISVNNIMFDSNGILKLIDFSHSTKFTEAFIKPVRGGSLQSWPPECRYEYFLTPAADIWSAGYCFAYMAIGREPFHPSDYHCEYVDVQVGMLPAPLRTILKKYCLRQNPLNRSTALFILTHRWLKSATDMTLPHTDHIQHGIRYCSREQQEHINRFNRNAERNVDPDIVENAIFHLVNHFKNSSNHNCNH